MTPAARLAAAIELLEAIGRAGPPIEPVIDGFVRSRRYMGAKDRRAVTGRAFAVLRALRRLDWHLARAGRDTPTARRRALAGLLLTEALSPADAAALFSGEGHAPAPLDAEETALAEALAGRSLDDPAMPGPVRLEYPDWLDGPLGRAFGPRLAAEMAALNAPAPLDLRVNTLKATPEAARQALSAEGVESEPTPLSPIGLRVAGRAALPTTRAFRDGLIEVQDEGSQIVALLAGARPGMTVIDFCAGAGGKTLALAAAMGEAGRPMGTLWALDVEGRFLKRLTERAARAGAAAIRTHALEGEADPWLAAHAGLADLALVDAPCSGSGVWRRHPAARAWLTPERLADLMARQCQALEAAAGLVRPGGRLVYATCSLLMEENEDRVGDFLAAHPDFQMVAVADAWATALAAPCPATGPTLRLSPATTGTDGFFAAILERARK
ncbi:RsmB/NOP family class I SAM-dependent RNA methyltransferase [Shumkonia mesophila]|uniref:RsmB/NOP family class I SAM-dependent RNA methyltransferase n=1 Tax=Shumkonia mesophila TaxID=2838854 RepID=UPI002934263A|nr:RsmB/NOP family class I SAM-dependent RNA methyltransferase [Shumkonia mesophila]